MMGENDCQCGLPRAVDMIVIDYLQLMSPGKIPGKEMRQSFAAVAREHRALARNLEIPVCTAWQVNRAGSDAMLLSMKDVAESWDLPQVADIIIGLNQSMEQLNNNRMVLNIVKQREGTDRGWFELYCDLDRMVIRDCTHQDTRDLVNVVLRGQQDCSTEKAASQPE
jgi:replicative DNA helicase